MTWAKSLAVSIRSESAGSTLNDVLVRRMRAAGCSPAHCHHGSRRATGPLAGVFHGMAENLPFGGTAYFEYGPADDPLALASITTPIVLAPGLAPQPVDAGFPLLPHQAYRYRLVVNASNGTQLVQGIGAEQLFVVPMLQ